MGNFVADMFAKQGLLGGLFAQVHPELDGLPTSRHEAACASGSMAVLAASAEIEAGRYDTACVLGIELMRNVPGQQAAENSKGGDLARARTTGRVPLPRAFSDLAEEYEKIRLDYAHLMQIRSQFRQWPAQPECPDTRLAVHRQELHCLRREPCRGGTHAQDGLRAGTDGGGHFPRLR